MYIEFEEGEKFAKSFDNDKSDHLDAFQDAGYILEEDDLVVDIDTLSKSAVMALVATFGINTQYVFTDRGVHFYFKKPPGFRWANTVSLLGIPIEYKHQKNTKAVTVKRFGLAREVVNEGVREELPGIFKYKKGFVDLQGLDDAEGRNNKLYAHKMRLGNIKGWQTILKYINYHVFENPLPDAEFETLARTEVIPDGEKNGEVEVAKYLLRKYEYLEYAGGYYYKPSEDEDHVLDEGDVRMLQLIIEVAGDVKTAYQDEVLRQMKRRAEIVQHDKVFKVKFNNGYLYEGEFYPINYKGFTPYNIDIDYIEDAEPVKIVDDYIDHLTKGDPEYKALLMEVLGHTLIVDPEFKRMLAKFFIFIGSGGNGKGTLLQIIKQILNAKNCTAMDIGELSDERYLVTFKGKLANLGDDIQDATINDKHMKVLKNITTCDTMSTRELYKQAVPMSFTGSLIFTSNHVLKSFEKGRSYKRRVLWLPMYTEVKDGQKDAKFITKLTSYESLTYWVSLIVKGYMRLYEQGDFSKCEIVKRFNDNYHQENNPYLTYLSDFKAEDFVDQPIRDVYKDCDQWCEDNSIKFSESMLRNTMKELFKIDTSGVRKINGKATKVFRVVDE